MQNFINIKWQHTLVVVAQAALYGKLAAEVLGRRRARQYDAESLQLSARLLELNPEVYTVWNYRYGNHMWRAKFFPHTSSSRFPAALILHSRVGCLEISYEGK